MWRYCGFGGVQGSRIKSPILCQGSGGLGLEIHSPRRRGDVAREGHFFSKMRHLLGLSRLFKPSLLAAAALALPRRAFLDSPPDTSEKLVEAEYVLPPDIEKLTEEEAKTLFYKLVDEFVSATGPAPESSNVDPVEFHFYTAEDIEELARTPPAPALDASKFQSFRLLRRESLSPDSSRLTFALPRENDELGMTVSSLVLVQGPDQDDGACSRGD